MPWMRKKRDQASKVEFSHFMDPGIPCEVCGDEADTVVVHDRVRAEYYCQYCTVIVTSEWSVHERDGRGLRDGEDRNSGP